MSVKHIFLETMFDDFTPDSVSREELISILLDDLMVVANGYEARGERHASRSKQSQ